MAQLSDILTANYGLSAQHTAEVAQLLTDNGFVGSDVAPVWCEVCGADNMAFPAMAGHWKVALGNSEYLAVTLFSDTTLVAFSHGCSSAAGEVTVFSTYVGCNLCTCEWGA